MSDRPFLLDTSVVLVLVRGNALGKYIDRELGLMGARVRPLVSAVTHGEVKVLAGRNQ